MGMPSSCCYLKPLPPISPIHPSSSSHNLAPRKGDGGSPWKGKHMVVGLACSMIISTEMGGFVSYTQSGGYSVAIELAKESEMMVATRKEQKIRVAKWSEKRVCPAWHFNSLETIVPENLPRPSAHRKWEWAFYSSQSAPSLKSSVKSSSTNCFLL